MLQLVGGFLDAAHGVSSSEFGEFYSTMFQRLPVEVAGGDQVVRYVGYEEIASDTTSGYFLGVETDSIEAIPNGMVGWDLGEDELRICRVHPDGVRRERREKITWEWRCAAESSSPKAGRHSRWAGEFAARDLGKRYRLTANQYQIRGVDNADDDHVRLVPHDPEWASDYLDLEKSLRTLLDKSVFLDFQHFGSTSIPGIPAKPIIDVLVEISSMDVARQHLFAHFNKPEWEYWWYSEHITLVHRNRPMGARIHHLHIAPKAHEVWRGIVFRDYLMQHPRLAQEYAELKAALAGAHASDRERYTVEKTGFVQRVLALASGEAG